MSPDRGRTSAEFVALVALTTSLVAMSIDTMLPALGDIARELVPPDPNDQIDGRGIAIVDAVPALTLVGWIAGVGPELSHLARSIGQALAAPGPGKNSPEAAAGLHVVERGLEDELEIAIAEAHGRARVEGATVARQARFE